MVEPLTPRLTVVSLREEAARFAELESGRPDPRTFRSHRWQRIGTYFEHRFRDYLNERYTYNPGNSARDIDFPDIQVDMKTTSIAQPQSSCPFKSARQKIYGLGYSLLVFVYEKHDDGVARTGRLDIHHVIFVEEYRTGDYQTTTGIRRILENEGNVDDLIAFMEERRLPLSDIEMVELAQYLLENPPGVGYLTISNALQWRLQYSRVIEEAGAVLGIHRVG